MTDPIRLRILKALKAKMGEITPANGYEFDMSDKVFVNRAFFGDGDPLPMLCILEPPIQPDTIPPSHNGDKVAYTLNLVVQGFMKDTKGKDTELEDAHKLLASVKKILVEEMCASRQRMKRDLLGVGPKLSEIRIATGSVRPADEISNKAYFWLNLNLEISEDLLNPFE